MNAQQPTIAVRARPKHGVRVSPMPNGSCPSRRAVNSPAVGEPGIAVATPPTTEPSQEAAEPWDVASGDVKPAAVAVALALPPGAEPASRASVATAAKLSPEQEKQERALEAVQEGGIVSNRLGAVPARLLAMPLVDNVLGLEVTGDMYAANAFRYLAVPADAAGRELDLAISRLKAIGRLRPEVARRAFIRTGYDGHVALAAPLEYVERLQDSRQRLLWEVFWPHVDGQCFEQMKSAAQLASPAAVRRLSRIATTQNGRDSVLAKHALAVVLHNRAIAYELAYGTGHTDATAGLWGKALEYWRSVLASEEFWDYLRERVVAADDPRLHPVDLQELRERMPQLILGFNRLFARAYAQAGDTAACKRQLRVIAGSEFPKTVQAAALRDSIQTVVAVHLEPLIHRAEECAGMGKADKNKKLDRKAFVRSFEPILAKAIELRQFLVQELHIADSLVQQSEFDRLCEIVLRAVNEKMDYSTDERLKAILVSILFARRMLQLPISASLRRRLEQNIRSDTEILYKDCEALPKGFDASQCWFLPGEEASPDDSLEMPVYKITKVTAANIAWEKRRILVPRSALAAKLHCGKTSAKELAASRTDESSRQTRGQIEELRKQRLARTEALQHEWEEQTVRQIADRDARIGQYDQEVAADEAKDKQYIERRTKELADQVAAQNAQCAQAETAVRRKHQPAIDEAEQAFHAASRAYRGLGRAHVLELPASGATAVAMDFAVLLFWLGGSFPPAWALSTALWIVAAAGAAAGLAIGRAIRARIVGGIRTPLTECERSRDAEIRTLAEQNRQVTAAANAKASQDLHPFQERVAQREMHRAAIRDECQLRIARLKEESQKQIDGVHREIDSQVQTLEKKLAERATSRPESAKTSFPPYKKAKADGYRDGREPPDDEAQQMMSREMTRLLDSLSQSQKIVVGLLAKQMSSEQFSNLLKALAEASPSERSKVLAPFDMLRMLRGY